MKKLVVILCTALMFSAPFTASAKNSKDEIREILKNNPDILFEIIQENPVAFMEAVQKAATAAKAAMARNQQLEEERQFEAAFNNPLKPEIRKDEAIRGSKNAPLVLVEYSDFQCPYCARGNKTVEELMKRYKGKIQFVYKHLPLSFHREAKLTARYYEALRMQKPELAFKFHDAVFDDINKLKQGEPHLKSLARKVGANMAMLQNTLKNNISQIDERIQQDINEASKFGFNGTPGFLLNGIPVRGAYPVEHFEKIIKRLQQKRMVKL